MTKLYVHLFVLPRWFAAPAAICAVALGCILGRVPLLPSVLAVVAGLFLMAWAHAMNTFLDHEWTSFDKGTAEERSRPKEYTSGQQPIASGLMKPSEVLAGALVWLFLSAVLTFALAQLTPLIWLPWALVALCTFLYSWGKLHYLCETALGLGFGSFAVMYGMAASTRPDMLKAFLAGLPFLVLWGFTAEFIDQATDAEANWPRGLRNLGALAWHNGVSVPLFTGFLWAMSYLVQVALIQCRVLAPASGLSLVALPFIAYGLVVMGNDFKKRGILLLLGAIFLHMVGLVVGQAIGG